jgi:flagellar motor switch protein FliM
MPGALSPEESARVLAGVDDDTPATVSASQRRRDPVASKMDFSRPAILGLAELRRFESAHEAFCAQASIHLSAELYTQLSLEVVGSKQTTWGAALSSDPQPLLLGVGLCSPVEQPILLGLEQELVLRILNGMLGGAYADEPAPRKLSDIDMALAGRVFEGLLATLSTVWRGLLDLETRFDRFVAHENCGELLPATEPTLVLTIDVLHAGGSSAISLLVPDSAIKANVKHLAGNALHADGASLPATRAAVRAAVGAAHVEVRAQAGGAQMRLGEVLSLAEGDVVRLGPPGDVSLMAGEHRLHRVKAGVLGSRRAVQIIEGDGAST